MTKRALLQAKQAIVKSAKAPKPPTERSYAEFDKFMQQAANTRRDFDNLQALHEACEDMLANPPRTEKWSNLGIRWLTCGKAIERNLAALNAEWDHYERDELYVPATERDAGSSAPS